MIMNRSSNLRAFWRSDRSDKLRQFRRDLQLNRIAKGESTYNKIRTAFDIIDIETGEKIEILGYDNLAKFLGFKNINRSMYDCTRQNKSKTKIYKITKRSLYNEIKSNSEDNQELSNN